MPRLPWVAQRQRTPGFGHNTSGFWHSTPGFWESTPGFWPSTQGSGRVPQGFSRVPHWSRKVLQESRNKPLVEIISGVVWSTPGARLSTLEAIKYPKGLSEYPRVLVDYFRGFKEHMHHLCWILRKTLFKQLQKKQYNSETKRFRALKPPLLDSLGFFTWKWVCKR